MDWLVKKTNNLQGKVLLPTNKSHSFRALIFAALADRKSRIQNPAVSADWFLGVKALEQFGAKIQQISEKDNCWQVTGVAGKVETPSDIINCGNSGILLRFLSAIASLAPGVSVLTGDHSLRFIRPMKPMIDGINQLGASAVSTKSDDKAPVVIRGELIGGKAKLDGRDSQPVSALLIASQFAQKNTILEIQQPGEQPWVQMTIDWLANLGVEIANENYQRYEITPVEKCWAGFDYKVPLDWSAAIYPIVSAILTENSRIEIPKIAADYTQSDRFVLDELIKMGADITFSEDKVIAKSSVLEGKKIDCNKFIDQLPILALVGACAKGKTELYNAAICRKKECDRIKASAEMLEKMGAEVIQTADGLIIKNSELQGANLLSYDDHRMVMTSAVAGLVANGETKISNCECVAKTFSNFAQIMQGINSKITVNK